MGGGLDRYMVFNAGRFAAFEDWFGRRRCSPATLPTASAVGIGARGAGDPRARRRDAGRPVENPRQVPAYRYSRRYGPLPPCFARGTIVRGLPSDADGADAPALLVGGTASIVGEDSLHDRDARQQALETFDNLARAGRRRAAADGGPDGLPTDAAACRLRRLHRLRVYIVRDEDAPLLREMVAERFGRTAPHRVRASRSVPARAAGRDRRRWRSL